ncbi:MAG: DUF4253 domain-containing protein [Prosthecobacter sp.]
MSLLSRLRSLFQPAASRTDKAARKAAQAEAAAQLAARVRAEFPFPLTGYPGQDIETVLFIMRAKPEDLHPRVELPERDPGGIHNMPVIVGEAKDALRLAEMWRETTLRHEDKRLSGCGADPAARAAADQAWEAEQTRLAAALDVAQWFAKQKKEADEFELLDPTDQSEIHPAGTTPMTRLTVGHDHKGRPHPEVFLASVPVPAGDSTLLPILLRTGDWNACPPAHVHTALARHWRDAYGAEIATVTADIIEYTVARPPQSDAQAAELALEQFLYCGDIVTQGVGSIATLARALRHSTRWYFWWD